MMQTKGMKGGQIGLLGLGRIVGESMNPEMWRINVDGDSIPLACRDSLCVGAGSASEPVIIDEANIDDSGAEPRHLKRSMRNLPCPCGSGKKVKKCCGNKYLRVK